MGGGASVNAPFISSFDIIDQFVHILGNRVLYPNLKKVTITGHSAGGQFTQRYAAGNRVENQYSNLNFRYFVLNPGSYLYLSLFRPSQGNEGEFNIPIDPQCNYHRYKYGLQNLNPYMQINSLEELISQYLSRRVFYFVGEKDTDPKDLDDSCSAEYQGKNSLERGTNYFKQLNHEYPQHYHQFHVVPGIGHTQRGMYLAPSVLNLLFENVYPFGL